MAAAKGNKYAKGKGGPTKYDEEKLRQAVECAKRGLIDKDIAVIVGVTEVTINNWKKSHPSFFNSLRDAKAVADDEVEQSLFKRAKGMTIQESRITPDGEAYSVAKEIPPDTTAMIFWLKNRRPGQWRDKVEHDLNHNNLPEVPQDLRVLVVNAAG